MTEPNPTPVEPVSPAVPDSQKKGFRWSEIIQVMLLTLVIVVPIRLFLANPFKVEGASMEPAFFDREYLIVDEITYRVHPPQRGEVVVFHPPNDPGKYYIKRVIGLPGETVELLNGVVKIYNAEHPNGWTLDEGSYIDLAEYTEAQKAAMTLRPVTLSAEEYFVMGDNRPASYDSRYFGPVKKEAFIGRAWLRGLPIQRWGVLTHLPDYPEPAQATGAAK